jgi:chaperone required for assembly of F1-ATPase
MNKGFKEPVEKPRRFYKDVGVVPVDDGFAVTLDGRRLRTPKGRPMSLPTRALAEQVAEEWATQGPTIEMAGMHATRLANTAVESVPDAREATAGQVAQFAGSDLVCYFAEGPEGLVARQEEGWGPILERAREDVGLAFVRASGIVHRAQPEETLARVRALALAADDFTLAGLAFGTALFGSAVLAIGVQRGWLSAAQAFELSRLDEAYQEEKWGIDSEAAERTERLRTEARMLERWFRGLEG